MTEFEDHRLLACKKVDGVEYLSIPANSSMLASIIDMMDENFASTFVFPRAPV